MGTFTPPRGRLHSRTPLSLRDNSPYPLQTSKNQILFHSGWGDGVYPVIGSFDSAGHVHAAHFDSLVLK
jgi:hypothetical protein